MPAPSSIQTARDDYRSGRLPEAEMACRRLLQSNPDDPDALHLLGVIAGRIGRNEDAARIFTRAAQLRPQSGEIRSALGTARFNLNQFDQADRIYRDALQLSPNDFIAWHNLAVIAQRRGHMLESAELFHRAVSVAPQSAIARLNLGTTLRDLGRMQDAWGHLRRAVELDPQLADAHMMLAWLLLLHGDFARGWPEYEWRWQCPGAMRPNLNRPIWDGSPLNGRTLLLHAEQGLGDTIQFVRYADLLSQSGARVLVLCPPSLQRTVATVPGVVGVFARISDLPPFDLWLPLMSLPLRLRTAAQSIPASVPYITADPARVAAWAERMRADPPGFKVGLCWAGNRANPNDEHRSIAPSFLWPLATSPDIRFYRLQVGEISSIQLPLPMIDHTAAILDFADTAALMTQLDLVISVDTAVAHLAGALGRPVWTLLAFAPDWRWMLSRPDSPWYPTMRLFRRKPLETWEPVLQEISARLAETSAGQPPITSR